MLELFHFNWIFISASQLSDHPDKTCADILRNIASQVKNGKPSTEERDPGLWMFYFRRSKTW